MANLYVWLLAAVGPLAKQLLVALGIGWVTYTGISALLTVVQNAIIAQWGLLGGATAQVVALFGFGQALGIILGGMAARAGLMAVSRLGKVTA